jgi:hypothetical protein
MDPKLQRIDELLDDDTLVDGVVEAMRGRFAQSGRRGRYGTPAEVALRLLVLKHLKDWSYQQLEWEVTGNLVYRYFCRIDGGKVPDEKTMVRLGQLLDSEVLQTLFDRVVALAVQRRAAAPALEGLRGSPDRAPRDGKDDMERALPRGRARSGGRAAFPTCRRG